jgi:hypothetical protein
MATLSSVTVLTVLSIFGGYLDQSGILIIPVSIIMIHFVSISVFLFLIRISIKIVYEFISATPEGQRRMYLFLEPAFWALLQRV